MELRLQQQIIYLVVLSMLASSKAANVVDVGGKSLSRGTDKGMAYAKFKAHKFSYLNITSIGSDIVAKGSECGLACVNIPSCFSFNLAVFFDINTGRILCELLPSDIYNNSKKLVVSQFHHHYSITSPCSSWPCQNNGMCAAQYEKNNYVCVCAKGYTGKYCETDINECASNPCLNRGTCTDRVNGYNCGCVLGFRGTRCEKDIDECASNPCLNGGTCTDRVNGYNCGCVPGIKGTRCETDINECASNPCLNGGTCTDRVNGYSCGCVPGFRGTRCETDKFTTNGGKGRSGIIQKFTVPRSSRYVIKAWGARGGTHSYNYGYNPGTYYGGKGAFKEGTFRLTKVTVLNIVVGQRGGDSVEVKGGQNTTRTAAELGLSVEDNAGTGGGGGSFVYTTSNVLLLAAGGGGGASGGYNGVDGQAGTSGTSSVGKYSPEVRKGGTGGQPGECNTAGASHHGGVGAGWSGQGCDRKGSEHEERWIT